MKRTVKKFIAIISAVALVVSSITAYNTKTAMADVVDWSTTSGQEETLQLGDWALYSGGNWAWDHMYGTYDTEATNYGGLTINIDEPSTSEWGIQLYTNPYVSVTAGQPYKVTLNITSNADFSFDHVKDDASGIDLNMTTVVTGENEITATYTPTVNSVKFLIAMDYIPTGTTFTINSLTYTPVTEEELGEQSGNIVDGMSWQGWFEAEGWANYVISNDATTYTLEDKGIATNWYSIQTGIDGVEFRSDVDYVCAFTLTTTAPKSFTVDNRSNDAEIFAPRQVTASDAGWVDNGNGTYSYNYVGTYSSASTSYLNVRVSLGYHDTDTYFAANDTITATVSDFIIESAEEYGEIETTEPVTDDSTTAETPTETSAPAEVTTAGEGDYDWTAVEASNGAYDYYVLEGSATIINLQTPAFGNGNTGIYITVSAGINDIYVNGVEHYNDDEYDEVQGAGCLINEQALTEYINTIVIEYAGGSATILIRNNNVTSGEETTPDESTSEGITGETTSETPTETSAPAEVTTADEGDYDWTAVDASYGAYDYYVLEGSATIINLQAPAFGNGNTGIYITVPAGISDIYVNGVEHMDDNVYDEVQGAGCLINEQALTEYINTIVIWYDGGTASATILIRNNNVTSGEETTPDESTSEEITGETTSETPTEAPVVEVPAPQGLTYAGNDDLPIYFAWAAQQCDYFNVYVNGDYVTTVYEDIFNGEGYESYFPTGVEVVFGVTAVIDGVESEMTTIAWANPYESAVETTTEETTTEETTPEETTTEETTPEETIPTYDVVIDGDVVATIEEGEAYALPTDSDYGYYGDGALYHGGESFTVDADLAFTTVEISVATSQGASIYLGDQSGIRFKTEISANVDALYDLMTEGTLITAADVYAEDGDLTLDSDYDVINVVNSGWYNSVVGTYCGSIVGVGESNYNRNFVAKGYVVLTYADGETETIYANMSAERSIAYVANAIIAGGTLSNYTDDQQAKIGDYASYYEA